MNITRIFDILDLYKGQYAGKPDALAGKENRKWVKTTSEQYVQYANQMSCGLLSLGLKPGDKVATITNNRPEWNFADMGMAQIGVIHVPLFTTLKQNEYKELLSHAEVKLIFTGGKAQYKKLHPLLKELKSIIKLYTFDELDGAPHWSEVLRLGEEHSEKNMKEVERIKSRIKPTDTATLIYTSGTTAKSKGVLLSHQNLLTTAKIASTVFHLQPDERYLSILPICHVGERMANYQTQLSGCSIYYAESISTIGRDLRDIHPHGFGAVPRILEKVYEMILAKGNKLKGMKRKLFFWALKLGDQFTVDNRGWWYDVQLKIANKLIFNKWREAIGGNIKAIGVGGAALQPAIERVFWAAGIKLLNMYGLTETSPIITINRLEGEKLRLGSVGALVDGVEVKIAGDGEILCRGNNVMKGYYKNDTATREAIDKDGWFHTGDIGRLEDGRFLFVTDRKKEIFKLSNGKYVSPLHIENKFKESIYIDQAMAVGEGQKFVGLIISPNFEALEEWCKTQQHKASAPPDMIKEKKVNQMFLNIIRDGNRTLSKDEQVKKWLLTEKSWSIETGELSPTLKLKRRVLKEQYHKQINAMYGNAL